MANSPSLLVSPASVSHCTPGFFGWTEAGQPSFGYPASIRIHEESTPHRTVAGRGDQACWAVMVTLTLPWKLMLGRFRVMVADFVEGAMVGVRSKVSVL